MSEYRTLITKDRLDEIVRLLGETPSKVVAELGVYKGGSLKYMADHYPDKWYIGYDTFEGLPKEHWNEDEIHRPGDFSDNSLEGVQEYLKDIKHLKLVKGLFPESAKKIEMPDDMYSFVHVDLDFYEGIKAALDFFYSRLVPKGIMVFDDFEWPNCPGVKKALDEWKYKWKREYFKTNAKYQAYIIKP